MPGDVTNRKGPTYWRTECLTCGKAAPTDDTNGQGHRSWADRHATSHKGHMVAMEHTSNRFYVWKERTSG